MEANEIIMELQRFVDAEAEKITISFTPLDDEQAKQIAAMLFAHKREQEERIVQTYKEECASVQAHRKAVEDHFVHVREHLKRTEEQENAKIAALERLNDRLTELTEVIWKR